MGLCGVYAHGITETWVLEKALVGLVACEAERHTAENIKKWTEQQALADMGLTTEGLLGSSNEGDDSSSYIGVAAIAPSAHVKTC